MWIHVGTLVILWGEKGVQVIISHNSSTFFIYFPWGPQTLDTVVA
jgi:hypothetical protein